MPNQQPLSGNEATPYVLRATTTAGKPVARFTIKAFLYQSYVDTDTGEVKPGEYTYRDNIYRKKYADKNILVTSGLDILLYHFHRVQRGIQMALFYDNERVEKKGLIFQVKEGIIIEQNNHLKEYPIMVKQLIPNYKIVKH